MVLKKKNTTKKSKVSYSFVFTSCHVPWALKKNLKTLARRRRFFFSPFLSELSTLVDSWQSFPFCEAFNMKIQFNTKVSQLSFRQKVIRKF